jgi:hypothetical protein
VFVRKRAAVEIFWSFSRRGSGSECRGVEGGGWYYS